MRVGLLIVPVPFLSVHLTYPSEHLFFRRKSKNLWFVVQMTVGLMLKIQTANSFGRNFVKKKHLKPKSDFA